MDLRFTHPSLRPWLPPARGAAAVASLLQSPVVVYLHRRPDLAAAWAAATGGRAPPAVAPYSFRAWAPRGAGHVHVLVDETETPASVAWLILHELTHAELGRSPYLAAAFRELTPQPQGYLSSDEAHEAHPEEVVADFVATRMLPVMGHPARNYDRGWWRPRVRARQRAGRAAAA